MRRFVSIAKATALEVVNEPLSLLLLSAALALAVFAPAFHYHQFGEATRMARDAGLSALLIGGTVFSVSAAVRSMRRELESGTAAVALSHPVSRAQFFLAIGMHCLGCPVSRGETIEEACAVHGTDADELIKNINEYLNGK